MSRLYRNVLVPVPDDAYVSKYDGRVYVILEKIYNPAKKYNTDKKASIGKAVDISDPSHRVMHPNDYYRFLHPDTFNENCKDNSCRAPAATKTIGTYISLLAIAQKNGLYAALIDSFGPKTANALMDYAMFSIIERSNVTKDFNPLMNPYLMFSGRCYSDSWFSDLFGTGIDEPQTSRFREAWISKCIKSGVNEAWICIDGTNNECSAEENHHAEHGHGKTKRPGSIVGYMWAVSAGDGTPITFDVYRGGRVDSKEVLVLVEQLEASGIKAKGFLLDRGFCTDTVIRTLDDRGIEYIILAGARTSAYSSMMKKYGEALRLLTAENMLDRSGIYGVSEENKVRIFASSDTAAYATFVYDSKNGVERVNALTDGIKRQISEANDALMNGAKPHISDKYREYIKEAVADDGDVFYVPDPGPIQRETERKGFSCMVSSSYHGATQTDNLYTLRQVSEKQYCIYKSQLGNSVMRVHGTAAWESKSCVGFIASILRNEFEKICFSLHYDTNQMIREMCLLTISQYPHIGYQYVHTENIRQIEFLNAIGVDTADLPEVARMENERSDNPISSPIHRLPLHEAEKRGPGRPKGSKNVIQKQKLPKPKKKRGRPKGSKNKKTLEREALAKRRPGRPKGSKNKKKSGG